MNTINNIVSHSYLSTMLRAAGYEAYVAECKQAAFDSLDRRSWANHAFAQITQQLPALLTTDVVRKVQSTAGEREQSFSYSVWAATLIPLLVTGYTNTQLINMQLEECFPHWDATAISKWSSRVFHSYVDAGLLSGKVDEWVGENRYPRCHLQQRFNDLFDAWADVYAGVKLLPMKQRPMDWTDGGTKGIAPKLGVSLVQRAVADVHIGKAALAGINAMQGVAFVVNPDIKEIVQEFLDNLHVLSFKNASAREATVRMCRKILSMELNQTYWLPITADYRGRVYYRGGELTPQGKDLAKAAFCFADGVELGDDGIDAMHIALANSFGVDKVSIHDRIEWSLANIDRLRAMSWYDVRQEADEPFQAYAIICELNRIEASNLPAAKFKSNLVIHMDGSQNGYQHQAAIIGDRHTAERTNLLEATDTDTPFDAYVAVLEHVANNKALSPQIRKAASAMGRAAVKNPVMTTQYNAGVGTFARHLLSEFGEQLTTLGVTAWDMARAYADAVDVVLPAARSLINIYADRFTSALKDGKLDMITWTLPDGFEVAMQYHDKEWRTIRAGRSAVVMPLEDGESDTIDIDKMIRALAANFIQSLDGCHMRMIAAASAFPIVGIHDSVGCHAGHYFRVAKLVRQKFIELHEHDVLNNMLRQNGVREAKFFGQTYHVAESQNAIYMFS
jgi:hypothetical protein